jgi:hypothetical protein
VARRSAPRWPAPIGVRGDRRRHPVVERPGHRYAAIGRGVLEPGLDHRRDLQVDPLGVHLGDPPVAEVEQARLERGRPPVHGVVRAPSSSSNSGVRQCSSSAIVRSCYPGIPIGPTRIIRHDRKSGGCPRCEPRSRGRPWSASNANSPQPDSTMTMLAAVADGRVDAGRRARGSCLRHAAAAVASSSSAAAHGREAACAPKRASTRESLNSVIRPMPAELTVRTATANGTWAPSSPR